MTTKKTPKTPKKTRAMAAMEADAAAWEGSQEGALAALSDAVYADDMRGVPAPTEVQAVRLELDRVREECAHWRVQAEAAKAESAGLAGELRGLQWAFERACIKIRSWEP